MNTDERIMKAALKEFAQKSYRGATTRGIAEEANFSELTLFRKFKNKQNLFKMVYQENLDKFTQEVYSCNEELSEMKFKDTREFLKTLIDRYIEIIEDNIEVIRITVFDPSIEGEPFEELGPDTAQLLKKNIKNDKIEYFTFGLTIIATLILATNNRYLGRTTIDHDVFLEKMTENFYHCI